MLQIQTFNKYHASIQIVHRVCDLNLSNCPGGITEWKQKADIPNLFSNVLPILHKKLLSFFC